MVITGAMCAEGSFGFGDGLRVFRIRVFSFKL